MQQSCNETKKKIGTKEIRSQKCVALPLILFSFSVSGSGDNQDRILKKKSPLESYLCSLDNF